MLKQAAYFHSLSPGYTLVTNQKGQTVAQLFEALRYKAERRQFESSGRTMTLKSTEPLTEMSTRIISWGVKAPGA